MFKSQYDSDAASASSLRNGSGIVSQDNFWFPDTMYINIILGFEEDDNRQGEAVETACPTDIVKKRPLGLNTNVGAEGEGLSGGERQRIMMDRGAYKILLI